MTVTCAAEIEPNIILLVLLEQYTQRFYKLENLWAQLQNLLGNGPLPFATHKSINAFITVISQ